MSERLVTVCAACLRAQCWQGKLYCHKYKTADVKEMPVSKLRELALEHPENWETKP